MAEKKGYIGRISNSGPQVVKAPNQTVAPDKGKVKTGTDLRTGKEGLPDRPNPRRGKAEKSQALGTAQASINTYAGERGKIPERKEEIWNSLKSRFMKLWAWRLPHRRILSPRQ